MLKESKQTNERMMILMNKNWDEYREVWINNLLEFFDLHSKIIFIENNGKTRKEVKNLQEIRQILKPNEILLIYSQ
jgi:hypothetical protein